MTDRDHQTKTRDPLDVTQFRFRSDSIHNRDMLECQAEKSFKTGQYEAAAQFSIAAALYGYLAMATDGEIPE